MLCIQIQFFPHQIHPDDSSETIDEGENKIENIVIIV